MHRQSSDGGGDGEGTTAPAEVDRSAAPPAMQPLTLAVSGWTCVGSRDDEGGGGGAGAAADSHCAAVLGDESVATRRLAAAAGGHEGATAVAPSVGGAQLRAWLELSSRHPKRFNARLQIMLEGVYAKRWGSAHNAEANKCPRCWMVPRHCLCKVLPPDAAPRVDAGVDVVVYFHWREASMRKASNTAKLVPLLLEGGRLVACGGVAGESELFRKLETDLNTAILFPSEGATTVREWWRERRSAAGAVAAAICAGAGTSDGGDESVGSDGAGAAAAAAADANTHVGADEARAGIGRPTLVVLDGTWSEARLLNKFLPAGAARVRLEDVPAELAQLRTRWAHPDRANVQSFSAIVAALGECGMPVDDRDALTRWLEVSIDAYVAQTFPEKAQKPRYTRDDVRRDRGLLGHAAAAAASATGVAAIVAGAAGAAGADDKTADVP